MHFKASAGLVIRLSHCSQHWKQNNKQSTDWIRTRVITLHLISGVLCFIKVLFTFNICMCFWIYVYSNWILIYSLSCSGYWTKYLKLLMQLIGEWLSKKTCLGVSLSYPSGVLHMSLKSRLPFLLSSAPCIPSRLSLGPKAIPPISHICHWVSHWVI